MNKEELRKLAIGVYENRETFGMLGCGISRNVYQLNDELVIKVEKHRVMTNLYVSTTERYQQVIEQIEKNHIFNKNYLNTISILNLGINKESVKLWVEIKNDERSFYPGQNITEALNYRALKFSPLQKHLLKVVDIFVYKNTTILIQERGITPKNIHCKGMIKFKEFVCNIFRKENYYLSDMHYHNILRSTSNKNTYLICDTGTCNLYDKE